MPEHPPFKSRPGFTVAEIAVVLAIVSLLAGLAIAPIGRAVDRASVRAASDELTSTLAIARQLAIMRSSYVTATLDTLGGTITVECAGDTTLRRAIEAVHSVTLSATRATIRFSPNGLGYGVSNLRIVARRRSAADTIYVSRVGRVRRA